ncbi:hypothetical protein LSAT2_008088 [Lamellibrachia satsuma]|nr:hypothetical protein LSAT2_008088 [Lamellibrachia satsuma]
MHHIETALVKGRARQLYKAGYKNLQQVAFAESSALVRAIEFFSHKAAKQIIASAKLLLTEKVESLREEADVMTTTPVDMPTTAVGMATEVVGMATTTAKTVH